MSLTTWYNVARDLLILTFAILFSWPAIIILGLAIVLFSCAAAAQLPADSDAGRVYIPVAAVHAPRKLTKGEQDYLWILRWRRDAERMCWLGCTWPTERLVPVRVPVKEPRQ